MDIFINANWRTVGVQLMPFERGEDTEVWVLQVKGKPNTRTYFEVDAGCDVVELLRVAALIVEEEV